MHKKPSIIFAGASFTYFHLHFLKLIGHLRMDGWEAILSIWDKRPIFRAELLVSGRGYHPKISTLQAGILPLGHFLQQVTAPSEQKHLGLGLMGS